MHIPKHVLQVSVPAICAFAAVIGALNLPRTSAMTEPPLRTDVRALPQRPDIRTMPLALGDASVRTTLIGAVSTAEKEFNLPDTAVDRTIGVVPARITVAGSRKHQAEAVWIVTADADIMGQGPATRNTVYRKLCIVINAASGRYEFAYAADPQRVG